jgi:hypothetical protein
MLRAMRGVLLILAAGAVAAHMAAADAADHIDNLDRRIVPTDRLAQPAEPAPFAGSPKHFLKAHPASAPRLSPRPEGVSPILPPLPLKGHRDLPPSTTAPLKPGRAPVNPPPLGN